MRKYESIRNTRTTQRAIHHILSTNTSKLLKFFFQIKRKRSILQTYTSINKQQIVVPL